LAQDDQVKVKVNDRNDSAFRQQNAGVYVVQPCMPVSFYNIKPEIWVKIVERDVEDKPGEKFTMAPELAAPAPGAAAPAGLEIEGLAKPAEAPAAAAADKPKTHKETFIDGYMSFNCNGTFNISDDYDASMPQSERMHEAYDAGVHRLVPVRDWKLKLVSPEPQAYFYVQQECVLCWCFLFFSHFVLQVQERPQQALRR
jgi:hypothetical protein